MVPREILTDCSCWCLVTGTFSRRHLLVKSNLIRLSWSCYYWIILWICSSLRITIRPTLSPRSSIFTFCSCRFNYKLRSTPISDPSGLIFLLCGTLVVLSPTTCGHFVECFMRLVLVKLERLGQFVSGIKYIQSQFCCCTDVQVEVSAVIQMYSSNRWLSWIVACDWISVGKITWWHSCFIKHLGQDDVKSWIFNQYCDQI